ncbi:Leucine-rich repeat-containing protein 26 [Habropoda laboriosa]|uniref:Leucine-rich repeat-containing protein 26 n=1 Tax=Habropoda laboriosa TaxID=597456 RepID=A0A0L7RE94_9HYME|nr:Leucine-rich repeat-containing protein 26 [Habropoda laboriosa]
MQRTSLFVSLLCILKCIGVVLAICTVNRHAGGSGNRLQCSNVTLQTISNQTTDVSAIMILNSNIKYIPDRAFVKFARYLQSLNVHNCNVIDVHSEAFVGLSSVKKLSLPNNNISLVKEDWFKDLVYLEQLDLSFNRIAKLEPVVFSRTPLLKHLDIRENRLTCLDPSILPGGISKVYFYGNPLTFKCRGKLTLWMRDHGVSCRTEMSEKEAWLDKPLWHCAISDANIAKSEALLKECVILNLFNQLRTGLTTAESYPLDAKCADMRNRLTNCIAVEANMSRNLTNGNVTKMLLLYLRQNKSLR